VKNILILRNVQLYIGIEHKKNVNIIIWAEQAAGPTPI
jgi:hypothetical protein